LWVGVRVPQKGAMLPAVVAGILAVGVIMNCSSIQTARKMHVCKMAFSFWRHIARPWRTASLLPPDWLRASRAIGPMGASPSGPDFPKEKVYGPLSGCYPRKVNMADGRIAERSISWNM